MPARTRQRRLGVLAEARDDAAPAFVDDVETARRARRPRTSATSMPAPPSGSELRRRTAVAAPSALLRPNISLTRRLTLRQISSRSGGPLRPRLPHCGSLRDMGSGGLAMRCGRRWRVLGVGTSRAASRGRRPDPRSGGTVRPARRATLARPRRSARSDERRRFYHIRRARLRARSSADVALVADQDARHLRRRRFRPAPRRRRRSGRSRPGWLASTTCSSRSASTVSFRVARNAATRSCGRSRMKPTVSERTMACASGSASSAQRRVEGGEQLVRGVALGARQAIEQRRFAGVGVADQRDVADRGATPRAALRLALARDLRQAALAAA